VIGPLRLRVAGDFKRELLTSTTIKTNSSGLITPKAGWSIRLSQSTYKDWLRGSDLN
jgi:hypothetical protein